MHRDHEQAPFDFTVRIRFRIPSRDRVGIDNAEVVVEPATGPPVTFKSGDKGAAIHDADWLVLQRSGWGSEDEAISATAPLADALRRTMARFRLGADLGDRSPRNFFFTAGLKMLENDTGRRVLDDKHGNMIYATDPTPLMARANPITAIRTIRGDQWTAAFAYALGLDMALSDGERTAFDLYSGAHTTGATADARFILLFSAVESLLDSQPRPKVIVDHVDRLIALTKDADIQKTEKESLIGSLRWMRSHSIRSAGRHLMRERLPEWKRSGKSAEEVFLDSYDLRNRLIHGGKPFPTFDEVVRLASALDEVVSSLIAGAVMSFALE